MDEVQFEDNQDNFQIARPTHQGSERSGITQLVIKMGIVKTQKDAEYVMIAVAIVALALAGYFMYSFVFPHSEPPSAAELQQVQEMSHGSK